jgi:glycosyltransferase involved in cell wall biosynthesis
MVAVMVANLHGRKDHATLLRAWAYVKERWTLDKPPVLLLAGRIDSGEAPDLAEALRMGETVRFLGPCHDVSSLLHAADFAVYSSRSEGLPNGILEAMAAGLSVAGTDIPGIREAVGPDGIPLLTPVGDAKAMAATILKVAADSDLRQRLGAANRNRVSALAPAERRCGEYARAVLASL